jgi:hypothetical protein
MGAVASALFETKKGAAFLFRQDQQNDAQIFVSFFEKNTDASQENRRSKRALTECICPKRGKCPVRIWAVAPKP